MPAISAGGSVSSGAGGSVASGGGGASSVGAGVAPPQAAKSMAVITNKARIGYSFLDISDLLLIEIFLIIQVY
jgi:hypothetical protein